MSHPPNEAHHSVLEPIHPDTEARTRQIVRDAWKKGVRRRRRRKAIAATAVLASVLGVLTFVLRTEAPSEPLLGEVIDRFGEVALSVGEASKLQTVATGVQSGVRLRLSGGSELRLDSNSHLRLERFVGRASAAGVTPPVVRLEAGTLHFRSARDSAPVPVETPFGRVLNVGTEYEIRLFEPGPAEAEGTLEITVKSGEVRFADIGGNETTIRNGQLLVLERGRHQVTRLDEAEQSERMRWVHALTPPFAIDGRTVEDFVRWVVEEQDIEVQWQADPATKRLRLRGELIWRDPEAAMAPTLRLVGLEAKRVGGTLVIE